jgi:hypothetical protein
MERHGDDRDCDVRTSWVADMRSDSPHISDAATDSTLLEPAAWRIQLVCVWCGPALVVLGLLGMALAGIFPVPPAADGTTAETVAAYAEHPNLVRAGLILATSALSLIGPLVAVITTWMLRMERGRPPTLSILQTVAGAVTWIMLMVPLIVMNVAAFRPERSPELTQTLTDLAWILFLTPVAPFLIQNVAIGAAVLSDPSPRPSVPRWVGYANFWVGLSFVPSLLAYFFKSGPFAWHGVFVFYLTFAAYSFWVLMMSWALRRAVLDCRRA